MKIKFASKEVPTQLIKRSTLHWAPSSTSEEDASLTDSIVINGMVNPILVRKNGNHYDYLAGGRRLAAAKKAKLPTVRCTVVRCDDTQARLFSLTENLQIRKLSNSDRVSGTEEMLKILRLRRDMERLPDPDRADDTKPVGRPKKKTREVLKEAAKLTNQSEEAVSRIDNLKHLIPLARQALKEEKIGMYQAAILAKMDTDKQKLELPKMIRETKAQTESRQGLENIKSDDEDNALNATLKAFDKISARCGELHDLIVTFRDNLSENAAQHLVKTERDLIIHCHRSIGSLLKDIESIESSRYD